MAGAGDFGAKSTSIIYIIREFSHSKQYMQPTLNGLRAQAIIRIYFCAWRNSLMSFQTLVLTTGWCFSGFDLIRISVTQLEWFETTNNH